MAYGYCPMCGAKGISRERRSDGNDLCENGHIYPSRSAIQEPNPELTPSREPTESSITKVPTGVIIVDKYDKGYLETLSIGDYGKHRNIKADFLGHTDEIHGVANGNPLPLQEKWVVTLSTQYGCPMKCTFCDVPQVGFKGNVSHEDLKRQLYKAIRHFPEVKYTDRLNIHFARMGEPVLNPAVLFFTRWLAEQKATLQAQTGLRVETIHPVLTTMCPNTARNVKGVIDHWCSLKNNLYRGQAGLQLSINSTSNEQRDEMFQGRSMSLEEISAMADRLPTPIGRKYCLNFAYATGNEVDGLKLLQLFDPEKWMVKITPIHNNTACAKNGIETIDGYSSYAPYKEPEQSCKEAGFDTLVFIPSKDEEDGLITCGNAILGGSYSEMVPAFNPNNGGGQ